MQVAAVAEAQVPGALWELSVINPEIDEVLKMRDGLIALIVLAALILSGEHSDPSQEAVECTVSTAIHLR